MAGVDDDEPALEWPPGVYPGRAPHVEHEIRPAPASSIPPQRRAELHPHGRAIGGILGPRNSPHDRVSRAVANPARVSRCAVQCKLELLVGFVHPKRNASAEWNPDGAGTGRISGDRDRADDGPGSRRPPRQRPDVGRRDPRVGGLAQPDSDLIVSPAGHDRTSPRRKEPVIAAPWRGPADDDPLRALVLRGCELGDERQRVGQGDRERPADSGGIGPANRLEDRRLHGGPPHRRGCASAGTEQNGSGVADPPASQHSRIVIGTQRRTEGERVPIERQDGAGNFLGSRIGLERHHRAIAQAQLDGCALGRTG